MNWFKSKAGKKSNQDPGGEDVIDAALQRAYQDPDARLDFYKQLLAGQIFVVIQSDNSHEGLRTANEGEEISIVSWTVDEKVMIPVFSSLNKLNQTMNQKVKYVRMKALDFFGMIGPTDHLILNPKSEINKEFNPQEIRAMVSGELFENHQEKVIRKNTNIMLGQPATYPQELVQSLSTFFKNQSEIEAAFLGCLVMEGEEKKPHIAVGIKGALDMNKIMGELDPVLKSILKPEEIVDFVPITDDSISKYMLEETQPFYVRA